MTRESNLGKWEHHYRRLKRPGYYADPASYVTAAEFLAPCASIEDWGCGKGGMRLHWGKGYLGVDGSASQFADVVADLADYRSDTPGILVRHVLEHDVNWEMILANAVASFRERMVLVLFTPMQEQTTVLQWVRGYRKVPDIGFAAADIERHFEGLIWTARDVESKTDYGVERIYQIERPGAS